MTRIKATALLSLDAHGPLHKLMLERGYSVRQLQSGIAQPAQQQVIAAKGPFEAFHAQHHAQIGRFAFTLIAAEHLFT